MLVETMAAARWRLLRVWDVQKNTFDRDMALQDPSAGPPSVRAAFAFRGSPESACPPEVLLRYEIAFDRQFTRALTRLMALQSQAPRNASPYRTDSPDGLHLGRRRHRRHRLPYAGKRSARQTNSIKKAVRTERRKPLRNEPKKLLKRKPRIKSSQVRLRVNSRLFAAGRLIASLNAPTLEDQLPFQCVLTVSLDRSGNRPALASCPAPALCRRPALCREPALLPKKATGKHNMTQPATSFDANFVLTLEEIGTLAAEAGKPAETLTNVVALIAKRFQTDVCSAYLLEPDRANLVLAATLGLRRECIGTLRMGLNEGLAGLVAERVHAIAVEQAQNHPRFKFFSDAGEEAYHSFLGVPLLDRGVLQGVLVVQTIDARAFREDEIQALTAAAAQVAPVVTEARTLARFIAPAQERLWTLARNLWWSWDNDTNGLFRDIDPLRWRRLNHNPISLLSEIPLATLEQRLGELVLHGRINYAYRRLQEYLHDDHTWGASNAGILRPRPVGYFSAEFGLHESLPVYSGGLGVLAGDHIKSASDLGIPLVGVGLFYAQGYFRQRLDANGWQQEEYLATDVNQLPREPAIGKNVAYLQVRADRDLSAARPSARRSGGLKWAGAI